MTRVSPARLRLAALANASAFPLAPHQRTALTVRSFAELLTPGDLWFLGAVAKLPSISQRQQDRLNELACKVERGRK
jgi:hypothetical protein